jgi:hypothetical protein
VVYALYCNRGKCNKNRFTGTTERKCKNAYADHQRVHDQATSAKKNLKKLKDKRAGQGKCQYCGKDPCGMKKRACIQAAASKFKSSMDIDMSDPAYFDSQMRDWFAD